MTSHIGPHHVVVTGLMGVGKSTAAAGAAHALDWELRDSDEDLEALFGVPGATIADEEGVAVLHELEAAVLLGALAAEGPSVIAAAASVVDGARCRQALGRRAVVVILEAPVELVLERMATGSHRRPMARAELEALAARRAPLFAEVADLSLDATAPPAELAAAIVAAVHPPATDMLND